MKLNVHKIPYSRKQILVKIIGKFKFSGGASQHITSSQTLRVYQGALASSHFKQSHGIYKKYNWQCASAELEIHTTRVDRCRAGPRVLLHTLHHYTLEHKNRFQFGSFNPDHQTAKFNSPSNFPAIRYVLFSC